MNNLYKQTILPALSLFTSFGTLICCALPALFVTLGMGAAVAGLVGAAPWITILAEHKVLLFSIAGGLILLSGWLQWQGRNAPCPADPVKANACTKLRKISTAIWGLSAILYIIGFFFAFLAANIFY